MTHLKLPNALLRGQQRHISGARRKQAVSDHTWHLVQPRFKRNRIKTKLVKQKKDEERDAAG